MNKTKIPWADYTWNPIIGCSAASEGCANCYAATVAHNKQNHPNAKIRQAYAGLTDEHGRWTGEVRFLWDRLGEPARLRKPAMIFVCSMSDIFNPKVCPVERSEVMARMGACARHTFMLLTKRPENIPDGAPWFSNIWVGVSAENQARFDERWEMLLRRTATMDRPVVRFVSVEPMLGPMTCWGNPALTHPNDAPDWVIAGPETGPRARRCDDAWIDALAAESHCFFDKRQNWTRREFPQPRSTP
jgi:protein gp37